VLGTAAGRVVPQAIVLMAAEMKLNEAEMDKMLKESSESERAGGEAGAKVPWAKHGKRVMKISKFFFRRGHHLEGRNCSNRDKRRGPPPLFSPRTCPGLESDPHENGRPLRVRRRARVGHLRLVHEPVEAIARQSLVAFEMGRRSRRRAP